MREGFEKSMERKLLSHLDAIDAMKERFYDRVMINPNDPIPAPAQRKRALNPTLTDFLKIVKVENVLFGNWKGSLLLPSRK